jgi:hypothetical protein
VLAFISQLVCAPAVATGACVTVKVAILHELISDASSGLAACVLVCIKASCSGMASLLIVNLHTHTRVSRHCQLSHLVVFCSVHLASIDADLAALR